jgi:[acyl-carrier-protein] S-malonyltransferase
MHAFLFPGQGSQAVGMGRDLAAASPHARELFGEIDDALGQNLSRLMFEGPADALTLTANAQPAIMASSLAVLRVLEREAGIRLTDRAAYVAGHSLGEYSALAAAGALGIPQAARLLRIRADAMQAAVPPGEGAMAAILALSLDDVVAVAAEACTPDEIVVHANDNAPGQVVISGHRPAVERAIELAKARGARRAMLLQVSAPFHCPLMAPAAAAMATALEASAPGRPVVPVVTNVSAAPQTDPAVLSAHLVEQVTAPVRWRESILALADLGVTHFTEFGAQVVGPMVKRIVPDATVRSLVSMHDLEGFA